MVHGEPRREVIASRFMVNHEKVVSTTQGSRWTIRQHKTDRKNGRRNCHLIDRKGGAKGSFMKNVILIFTYVVIGALTLGIIVSSMGREVRNVELQSNLSNAVEESLANAMEEKNYTIADQNEFLADVTENITEVLDTNSTVDVKVMKADLNKGLLSLRVVESFNYVNGKTGSVKCDRTVVFDKREQDAEDKYDVYYYISADDDRPYKRYTLLKGETILVPKEPSRAGYTFEGWKDADGNALLSDQIVESELTYVAQWSGSGLPDENVLDENGNPGTEEEADTPAEEEGGEGTATAEPEDKADTAVTADGQDAGAAVQQADVQSAPEAGTDTGTDTATQE